MIRISINGQFVEMSRIFAGGLNEYGNRDRHIHAHAFKKPLPRLWRSRADALKTDFSL